MEDGRHVCLNCLHKQACGQMEVGSPQYVDIDNSIEVPLDPVQHCGP